MQAVSANCIIEVRGWVNVRPYMPLPQSAYCTFTAWPPPSWILEKFAYLTQWSILAGTRGVLLKFGENCFILAEIINIFRNPRWRPPPSWIFKIFIFRWLFVCIISVDAKVEFWQWSVDALKGVVNFSIFLFWLEFPFWGPVWSGFWGRTTPKWGSYNSNPQKAQLATEWRHLTPRS